MGKHVVCPAVDLPPGATKIVEVGRTSIGVLNVGGRLHAVRNMCPHRGAPLCLGSVSGRMLDSAPGEFIWGDEGKILRCPWHGRQFDIETGRAVQDPQTQRVRVYPAWIEDDLVVIEAGERR